MIKSKTDFLIGYMVGSKLTIKKSSDGALDDAWVVHNNDTLTILRASSATLYSPLLEVM
jgi:hypothetical protein